MKGVDAYQGRGLIADPIHRYILYTRPDGVPGRVLGVSRPVQADMGQPLPVTSRHTTTDGGGRA